MIENQAPDIRGVRESEPEKTADVVNRGVRSGRPHDPSPDGGAGALFARKESDDLRVRWHKIQGHFVDEPRHAVEEADQLVASVIGRLTETFADQRSALAQEWSKGESASTEDLRRSLREYRSLFDRLLAL
jgi:hypothetical protein